MPEKEDVEKEEEEEEEKEEEDVSSLEACIAGLLLCANWFGLQVDRHFSRGTPASLARLNAWNIKRDSAE